MDTVVGRRPDQLRVYLVKASRQTLGVEWLDDTGKPMTLLSGSVVTLEVDQADGTVVTFTGIVDGTQTSWPLTSTQTDLPSGSYKGRVVINDGDPAGPLVALIVFLTVE